MVICLRCNIIAGILKTESSNVSLVPVNHWLTSQLSTVISRVHEMIFTLQTDTSHHKPQIRDKFLIHRNRSRDSICRAVGTRELSIGVVVSELQVVRRDQLWSGFSVLKILPILCRYQQCTNPATDHVVLPTFYSSV